jgi:hypothetical protein
MVRSGLPVFAAAAAVGMAGTFELLDFRKGEKIPA